MNTWKQHGIIVCRSLLGLSLVVVLCGLLTTTANGAVIVVDDMFPTDGALVGQTPSPGPGGTWVAHSGAGSVPIMVAGSQVVLTHGGGSREDANSSFFAQTTGTVNYSFDFSVDDLGQPFTGTDAEYFASYGATGASSTLLGRLDLVAPQANGDFTLGIATASGSAEATWGTDFNYLDVISISVDYDIDNNQAFLSVNGGTPIAATAAGAGTTSIHNFSFRQSNSSNDETIRIDNLKVTAPVPEPASAWLLIMSGITLLLARRR